MANFKQGAIVKTREPVISVDNALRPGRHRFQLRVRREDERQSLADEVIVEITEIGVIQPRPIDSLEER